MSAEMFCREHFHTGYAVRDVDRAIASLRARMGIAEWKILRLPDDAPGHALAFARVGNTMWELVAAKPGRIGFYDDWIPQDPDVLQVHHQGYFARDAADYAALSEQFVANGFAMLIDERMPGVLSYRYFDTLSLLGHYTEFVLLDAGGEAFFADVPRN